MNFENKAALMRSKLRLTAMNLHTYKNRCVVMTHGFYGSKEESHGLYTDLEHHLLNNSNVDKIKVIRFDFRGCGSNPDISEERTFQNWIDDLEDVMNNVQHEPVDFIGFSLGAAINLCHFDKFRKRYQNSKFVFLAPAFWPDKDMYQRYYKEYNISKRQKQILKNGRVLDQHTINSLNINTEDILKTFTNSALVVHSLDDPVIPMSSGIAGFNLMKSKHKKFIQIEGCGHSFRNGNDLSPRNKVFDKISQFLFHKQSK